MRLRRIELLCLRAADGLASERDLETLRKAGIDPTEWMTLSSTIAAALRPTNQINIADDVCHTLEIDALPLSEALTNTSSVDLVDSIMSAVLPADAEANTVAEPIEETKQPKKSQLEIVEDPLTALPKMEEADTLSLKDILIDSTPPPHIVDDVLAAIAAIDAPVEEKPEEEDIFVLNDFIEETKVSEELVLDIETDMELPIGEALRSADTPNLVPSIMQLVHELGPPQPHLRLISNGDTLVDENQFEIDEDSDEQIGGVLIEIKEIKSPVEIDADMVIHRAALYAFSGAFAIAAAAILTFMLYDEPTQQTQEAQSSIELASVDNSIDILELESDVTVQIIPPVTNSELTIIFIEDPEGEEQ